MINYFWFEHFVDTDDGLDCTSWYDDIVLASEYIGPSVATPLADGAPAAPTRLRVQ